MSNAGAGQAAGGRERWLSTINTDAIEWEI
jgi:hypothetical protein